VISPQDALQRAARSSPLDLVRRIDDLERELGAVMSERDAKEHALVLLREEMRLIDEAVAPFTWMAPPHALTSLRVKVIAAELARVKGGAA